MGSKRILVTGAGTGIGRDTVKTLIGLGHEVIATTYSEEQADALRDELPANTAVFKMDITDETDRLKIDQLPIDVLINNAAIGDSGSLAEVDIDRIRTVFEVNVFSTLALTQLALRGMIERGRGTVIFISSVAGRIPMPFLMPYSMTKFSLSAAAAGLREEMKVLDKGIQVCVVEPGAFHTGFNQSMVKRKYAWMADGSYFTKEQTERVKREEQKTFRFFEATSTKSIVKKIAKAAEAERPKLRYVAPWIQAVFVRLARIFGR